jgi:hypothetical protein
MGVFSKPLPLFKTLLQQVTSNKMQKTAVVEVSRLARHPKFGKVIKHRKKFYVRPSHCPHAAPPPDCRLSATLRSAH